MYHLNSIESWEDMIKMRISKRRGAQGHACWGHLQPWASDGVTRCWLVYTNITPTKIKLVHFFEGGHMHAIICTRFCMTVPFQTLVDPRGVDVIGFLVYVPINLNVKVKSLWRGIHPLCPTSYGIIPISFMSFMAYIPIYSF